MGYSLVRYFFLLCFAACIPAIISGGIAERAKFWPQLIAGAVFAGLAAVNSLLAMVGGVLAALVAGKNDPGFVHNGALAGLIAVCAGSDLMHPLGALATGAIAAVIFVYGFQFEQEKLQIDDVLGVWPLHGMIGTWGGSGRHLWPKWLGGMGGISFVSQLCGSLLAVSLRLQAGFWCMAPWPRRSVSGWMRKMSLTVPI